MITPTPSRVDNAKDAALWMVLNSMEQIDNNTSSRATWAQNILFNVAMNLDGPAFKEEIRTLREVLGVKELEPEIIECPATVSRPTQEEGGGVAREELFIREL